MKPRRYLVLVIMLVVLLAFSGVLAAGMKPSIVPDPENYVERISGENRFLTAIAISLKIFPEDNSADSVVLTRSHDFPDGLAGAPLAYNKNGPVLLTNSNSLTDATAAEIARVLKPGGIVYVLGGVEAISADIVDALAHDYEVKRLEGATRYSTAVEIAKELTSSPESVFLVTGENFADALSISSVAAKMNAPVLLTRSSELSAPTAAYLSENEATIENVYVIGGNVAISEDVFIAAGGTRRIEGPDRFLTAQAVAEEFFLNPNMVVLATSHDFPDALAGGVLAAAGNAPLLLTRPAVLNSATNDYIEGENLTQILVLGGYNVVSNDVLYELDPENFPNPGFIVILTDGGSILGYNWPVGTEVNVTINGASILTGPVVADDHGEFNIRFSSLDILIEADDIVIVTGGGYTRSHKVHYLEVTAFDEDANTISGKAEPGSTVEVVIFTFEGDYHTWPSRTVVAVDGTWVADFSVEGPGGEAKDATYNLTEGLIGSAEIKGEFSTSTLVYWHLYYPNFEVFPHEDWIHGVFTPSSTITVDVDDGSGGFTATTESDESGYFVLELEGYSLEAGHIVTVSDTSGIVKTHTITSIEITEVNWSTGLVKGTADAGTWVEVLLLTPFDGYGPPSIEYFGPIGVGLDGSWEIDLDTEIEFNVILYVIQQDDDGDSTVDRRWQS